MDLIAPQSSPKQEPAVLMAYRLFIFTGLLLLAAKLGMASNDSHEVIGDYWRRRVSTATAVTAIRALMYRRCLMISVMKLSLYWMKVFDRKRGEMPPKDTVQPADELRAKR